MRKHNHHAGGHMKTGQEQPEKTRNRLRHPAKVVGMCPSNTKSPNTSYEKCVQARDFQRGEARIVKNPWKCQKKIKGF